MSIGLILPLAAAAQEVAFPLFPIPTTNSVELGEGGITTGPGGVLWFTENASNKIGRIASSGSITEYPLPAGASSPDGIVSAYNSLWFAANSGQIGRMTTAGVFSIFTVPTPQSYPAGIALGADGALWFTEQYVATIGRMTPSGVFTEYTLPATFEAPEWITAGPDGALWFTNESVYGASAIGRITTAGLVTEYTVSEVGALGLTGITTGPDGALWFTEEFVNQIGRITTAGAVTVYPIPSGSTAPYGITSGPDGELWFTEYAINMPQIASITTAGVITEYPELAYARPSAIARGPNNTLWFIDENVDGFISYIGEVVFPTAGLGVSPAQGHYQAELTFTGSGFAANEQVTIYSNGVGSSPLTSAAAGSSGSFTVTVRQPKWPFGPRVVLAQGQSSGLLGAATYSVNEREVLSPTSGPTGASVTAYGYGFGALETVRLEWEVPRTSFGPVNADINGNVVIPFTVPADAAPGQHQVHMIGSAGTSATFTVE
jgi:virginiamycin B lyase